MLFNILICFLAGMGAGLGTGFAGLSAAAVISPMLITFLNIPAYEAVGIALSSDVLASAVSAYSYGKHKNIDIKNGIIMMIAVLCFTMVGSWVSSLVANNAMGDFSLLMTLIVGIRFIVKPIMKARESLKRKSRTAHIVQSVICGSFVGFICGFIGAGGGMMMLIMLTSVLGYDLKKAVGTSVFIMSFTALTGAVSHFVIDGLPDITLMVLCILFTLIWARIAAHFANKFGPEVLNRVTGVILVILAIALAIVKLVK